ncbi:uncharacterized protein LOC131935588 [Physella acuta]|uniref:uncharacterized protein LOC131935588 n=1 Tax=Physella acuta TaxID=109671 RepID=UPI0027DC20DB|nr:uncharacterized protein LOC131935588 [Physella acuta]
MKIAVLLLLVCLANLCVVSVSCCKRYGEGCLSKKWCCEDNDCVVNRRRYEGDGGEKICWPAKYYTELIKMKIAVLLLLVCLANLCVVSVSCCKRTGEDCVSKKWCCEDNDCVVNRRRDKGDGGEKICWPAK